MTSAQKIQFVSEGKIDLRIIDKAAIVTFANQSEEDRYVALDTRLIEEIKKLFRKFGAVEGKDVHHIEDWWRNHLRGVESDPSNFRPDLLYALQSLLSGEFAAWRIIIHFYAGLSGEAPCGSALITSDGIFATKDLKKRLPVP